MENPTTTTAISEDAIKRAVVPFLRHFYKYRFEYRPGTDRAEFDAEAAENSNIRADVLLRFQKQDGQNFVCAVEATSQNKLGEVKFGLNRPFFLWDAAMWAALGLAAIFIFLYSTRLAWFSDLGWRGVAGLILSVGAALFWAFFFLLKSRSKFRYIYAIEQFKRYRADEQWVALAVDVFADDDREGYEELRKQLISGGFGLISVENDGRCQAVIAPSKLGQFGEGRRFYDFIPAAVRWENRLEKIPKKPLRLVGGAVKKGFQKVGGDRAVDPMGRFMRSFFYQKAVFGFGLLIVAALAWRSKGFESIRFFSPKQAAAVRDSFRHVAEDREWLEGDDIFFRETPRAYLSPEEMALAGHDGLEQTSQSDTDFVKNIREAAGGERPVLAEKRPKIIEKRAEKARIVRAGDLCDRFSGRGGWLVQDNFFSQKDFADDRVLALRHRGFVCATVRRNCFEKGKTGWVVFLGGIFRDEKTARAEAQNFQKAEDRYGLLKMPLLVKKF